MEVMPIQSINELANILQTSANPTIHHGHDNLHTCHESTCCRESLRIHASRRRKKYEGIREGSGLSFQLAGGPKVLVYSDAVPAIGTFPGVPFSGAGTNGYNLGINDYAGTGELTASNTPMPEPASWIPMAIAGFALLAARRTNALSRVGL